MKKILTTAGLMSFVLFFAAALNVHAQATPGKSGSATMNGNKLQCFSGTVDDDVQYNGTCVFEGTTARLMTDDGDGNPNNNYAGVYIENSNLDGKVLSEVNQLSFTYSGTGAAGGSPRLTIPIDENNDGMYEGFAYIDTLGCNNGDANTGTLDLLGDASCTISYQNVGYENWQGFVSAHPDYRVAAGYVPFIIVDQPGTFSVTDVRLGRGPARPAR